MRVRFLSRHLSLIAFVILSGFCSFASNLRAADLACGCRKGACACVRRTDANGWKVIESRSFRIHHVGTSATAERLVPICEQTRQSLCERWLADTTKIEWTPKCDLFLYPSGGEFQRLTRNPADMLGFADLEIGPRGVSMRRLHLRADDTKRLDKLLVHELTHVVLADYFAKHQIPRWADEGIAVLSEPAGRRADLRRWLTQEAAQGRVFSLSQLASQRMIPRDKRLGDLFYAQSAALIEFLMSERKLSEPEVLRFVSESETRGLNATLTRWFPDVAVAEVDSAWRRWMTTTRTDIQVADDRDEARTSTLLAD